VLFIRDNGRGFDINHIPPGHFGVTIMRERAVKIGAVFDIASQPRRGANITLVWKMRNN
jgi:two-component system nitrate/nitrite sensor histidine kinase NarQ